MARKPPTWFQQAATMLAAGQSVSAVAAQVGVRRESLSRRLHSPGSSLAAEVQRLKSEASAEVQGDGRKLIASALGVVARQLDSGSDRQQLDAARMVLSKFLADPAPEPVAQPDAAPATAEQAIGEMVEAMTLVVDLVSEVAHQAGLLARLSLACQGLEQKIAQVRAQQPSQPAESPSQPAASTTPEGEKPTTLH